MSTKIITITEEAYNRLKLRKEANESFSQVINRKFPYTKMSDFIGVLSKVSANKLEAAVMKVRAEMDKEADSVALHMRSIKRDS